MSIDVVYIVGKGSTWSDNELRYSLRSLQMHLKRYGEIVIVGHCPAFINREEITWLPYEDKHKNKARNIMEKVANACLFNQLSEKILLMNDDYYLNQAIDAPTYQYYFKNTMEQAMKANSHNEYLWHLKSTYDVLLRAGKPTKNFDTHCPIIYNRRLLIDTIKQYDWTIKNGYTLRSLYCNTLFIEGVEHVDCKMNRNRLEGEIYKMIKDRDCFSTGEQGLNKSMQNVLKQLYPQPSKFEK